ncbi:MAG: hypothetical protein OXD45_02730 [Rhodobacteraceae bacterium]|nr:hypothetical protein [Paracoccaceae bacterium]
MEKIENLSNPKHCEFNKNDEFILGTEVSTYIPETAVEVKFKNKKMFTFLFYPLTRFSIKKYSIWSPVQISPKEIVLNAQKLRENLYQKALHMLKTLLKI